MKKKKPTMREQIAELEAELAGCEVRIEDLEAKNSILQKRVDDGDFGALLWLREDLRSAGIADHVGIRDGVRELADIIEASRAHAAESEREAAGFREELRAVTTDRDAWKSTAQSLAKIVHEDGDSYFDPLEKTERQRVRNVLRRVVRRALEVVR